jgi:hypothetical protein
MSQPVCLILASVLHFAEPDEADAVVAALTTAMTAGSYLIISAATGTGTGTGTGTDPDLITRLQHACRHEVRRCVRVRPGRMAGPCVARRRVSLAWPAGAWYRGAREIGMNTIIEIVQFNSAYSVMPILSMPLSRLAPDHWDCLPGISQLAETVVVERMSMGQVRETG